MKRPKPTSHTNNEHILPGDDSIIFERIDQNVRIRVNFDAINNDVEDFSCFAGGLYYLGGTGASDDNDGSDPLLPAASLSHLLSAHQNKDICGPWVIKVRPGAYNEVLHVSGMRFSAHGWLQVQATDEETPEDPGALSFVDFISTGTSPVLRDSAQVTNTDREFTFSLNEGSLAYPDDYFLGKRVTVWDSSELVETRSLIWRSQDSTTISLAITPELWADIASIEEPGVSFNSYHISDIIGTNDPDILPDSLSSAKVRIVGIALEDTPLSETRQDIVENIGPGIKITFTACTSKFKEDSSGSVIWRDYSTIETPSSYMYVTSSGSLGSETLAGYGYSILEVPDSIQVGHLTVQCSTISAIDIPEEEGCPEDVGVSISWFGGEGE